MPLLPLKATSVIGGMDIIAYYYANRKSEGVGKYTVTFNLVVVVFYFVLNLIHPASNSSMVGSGNVTSLNVAITSLISSVAYLVMNSFVIDLINVFVMGACSSCGYRR